MSQHGLSSSINICSIYLLTEHRRHQILPGLVRDGDIGFKGIVVFVTGEGHHDLGRHPLFKGVDDEGSSCCVRPYHVTKGFGHNHSINSVPGSWRLFTGSVHGQRLSGTLSCTLLTENRHQQGIIRRSVHIIESKVHSVCTLSTSASQTSVFHIFVVHNSVEAWLPSRGGGTGSRLSRQTAAHRHRLWATGTPIPVRQVPILACGAPQSLAQRAESASRCGCG